MGLITLDIDGTITDKHESVPTPVVNFLRDLAKRGWHLLFVTGRSFPRTKKLLSPFDFPYHLAVQNGAQIFAMPSGKRVQLYTLDKKLLPRLEKMVVDEPTDLIIYTDNKECDVVLYRKGTFSEPMLDYLVKRSTAFHEKLECVDSFANIAPFPAVKILGDEKTVQRIQEKILVEQLAIDLPLIRDPFQIGFFVAQATPLGVNKGAVVDWFCKTFQPEGQVIVAGDDYNDLTMLKKADTSIVMASAPASLLAVADVIAPAASENGIIQGLREAIG